MHPTPPSETSASSSAPAPFRLGAWTVDGAGNRLIDVDGRTVPLRNKAMALLLLLAERPGQTVMREEIVERIWDGNQFVAPQAINNAVWTIRQALGDNLEAPRYLETIAKKGYRLIADVEHANATTDAPAPVVATATAGGARRRLAVAAVTIATLALFAAAWLLRAPPPDPPPTPLLATPLTHYAGHEFLGALSPDGRLLAFSWWQGKGDAELHLRAQADAGAKPRAIGGAKGDVTSLSWSPDGGAIAYAARHGNQRCELWVYTLATDARRSLGACEPMFTPIVAWSPDGRRIVVTASEADQPGLFTVAPEGGPRKRLTGAAAPDHQPAWSPDGRRLAFVRSNAPQTTRDLYELDVATGQVQRLSHDELHDLHGITYAADGRDLIYSTTRHDSRVLMRWQRRGGHSVPLGLEGSAPMRAADGSLVYALLRSHTSIGHLALDGGDRPPQRLVGSVASDRQPSFSATRAQLAFVTRRAGSPQLWLAAAGGGETRQLTRLDGPSTRPAWSPDGRRLAFLGHCGEGGRAGLCVADADSGLVGALVVDGHDYGAPAWDADGHHLWISSNRGGTWRLWRVAADGSSAAAMAAAPAAAAYSAVGVRAGRLFYVGQGSQALLEWDPATSAVRRWLDAAAVSSLVHWQVHRDGLLLLSRTDHERFALLRAADGVPERLGQFALGTFPEMASFSFDATGKGVYIELSDTAHADLMQAREAGARP